MALAINIEDLLNKQKIESEFHALDFGEDFQRSEYVAPDLRLSFGGSKRHALNP